MLYVLRLNQNIRSGSATLVDGFITSFTTGLSPNVKSLIIVACILWQSLVTGPPLAISA